MFLATKLIIYLKRNTIEVYRQNTEGYLGRLEFPPDTARDEEVVNGAKFEQTLFSFLIKLGLKEENALIALSDEVIFQKTIPISNKQTQQKQTQEFFQEVPFDLQKIAQMAIKTKNGVSLFATNKNLFLAIVNVCAKMQKNVEAVVPVTMFGITQTATTLSSADLNKITSNSRLLAAANFLTSLAQQPAPQAGNRPTGAQDQQSTANSFLVLVGITIVIIGIVTAFFLYKKPNIKNINLNLKLPSLSFLSKKSATQISSSPSGSGQNPNSQQQVAKDKLTVQVLNGTGKEGQASLVKGSLEDIGFSTIETGNAQTQGFEATTVDFSQKVSTETRQEVVSELEKLFAEIKMDVNVSQEFDVIVTTGKQK